MSRAVDQAQLPTGSPPVLDAISDQTAHPTVLLELTVTATDPDGDSLDFTLTQAPAGATITAIDGQSATFSWTPLCSQLGNHTVKVRATDPEGNFDEKTFSITVTNDPPELPNLGDIEGQVGVGIAFQIEAIDPDGQALTYSLVNPPAGATIDNQGNFSWTPGSAGVFPITVRVTDPCSLTDQKAFQATIT